MWLQLKDKIVNHSALFPAHLAAEVIETQRTRPVRSNKSTLMPSTHNVVLGVHCHSTAVAVRHGQLAWCTCQACLPCASATSVSRCFRYSYVTSRSARTFFQPGQQGSEENSVKLLYSPFL